MACGVSNAQISSNTASSEIIQILEPASDAIKRKEERDARRKVLSPTATEEEKKDADYWLERDEIYSLRKKLEVYPQRCMVGDRVYVACYNQNIYSEVKRCSGGVGYYEIQMEILDEHDSNVQNSLSVYPMSRDEIKSKIFENPRKLPSFNLDSSSYCSGCIAYSPGVPLSPRHELFVGALAFDIPLNPLVEKALNENGSLTLLVKGIFECESGINVAFQTKLHVKPRPEKEMALLRQWNNAAAVPPENLSSIKIPLADYKYMLLSFMPLRPQLTYPPLSAAPTTLEGWKALEQSISPSTLKDEIRLAVYKMEWTNATDYDYGKDNVEMATLPWLKTLPPVQAYNMNFAPSSDNLRVDLEPNSWYRKPKRIKQPKCCEAPGGNSTKKPAVESFPDLSTTKSSAEKTTVHSNGDK